MNDAVPPKRIFPTSKVDAQAAKQVARGVVRHAALRRSGAPAGHAIHELGILDYATRERLCLGEQAGINVS